MKDPLLLIKCTLYCGIIYYLGGGGLVSKLFGGDFFSLIANIIILWFDKHIPYWSCYYFGGMLIFGSLVVSSNS